MDFGKVLDKWEGRGENHQPKKANDALRRWLDSHDIENKDANITESLPEKKQRLKTMPPEARIDLHQKTADEAWAALDDFFYMANMHQLKKVLVIHGKGNHSKGGSILKELCRKYIEQCPFTGESGHPESKYGGSGATWVILKLR
jgi:DNA-nicking Smr family endonuclease